MRRFLIYIALPIGLLLWGRSAFYTVDYAEYAYARNRNLSVSPGQIN